MSSISQTNQQTVNLNTLPFAHLGLISSFNSSQVQKATSIVCKHLNEASQSSCYQEELRQAKLAKYAKLLQDRQNSPLSSRPIAERTLYEIASNIASFFPKGDQRRLQVIGLPFFTKGLDKMLDVTNKAIKDEELIALLKQSNVEYTHINLSGCSKLTATSLTYIAKFMKAHSLDLSHCNFNDKDIVALAASGLRKLNLSHCKNIKGAFFDRFKELTTLNLTGCTLFKAGFKQLHHASNLDTLILAYTNASDRDIVDGVRGTGPRALRRIDLTGCKSITESVFDKTVLKDFHDGQLTLNLDKEIAVPKLRAAQTQPKHFMEDPLNVEIVFGSDEVINSDLLIAQIHAWKDALRQKRIGELYKTQEGLRGHAVQIQCELNRLTPERLLETYRVWMPKLSKDEMIALGKKYKGWDDINPPQIPGNVYSAAVSAQEELREAVLQAQKGAAKGGFVSPVKIGLNFSFLEHNRSIRQL